MPFYGGGAEISIMPSTARPEESRPAASGVGFIWTGIVASWKKPAMAGSSGQSGFGTGGSPPRGNARPSPKRATSPPAQARWGSTERRAARERGDDRLFDRGRAYTIPLGSRGKTTDGRLAPCSFYR